MNSDQELPSDIIFEILSRTSLTTLDACKAVCQEWKQLTYEPSFMPLYCKRTSNLCGYLIQTILRGKFLSTFVSINQAEGEGGCIRSWPNDGTKILASSSQGILCCERRKYKSCRYYACKPATQQWQTLPNPKLRYKTAGVAIMVLKSRPLRYKIVRLSELPGIVECMKHYTCEIFDSEIWRWRQTQGVSLPYLEFITNSHPVVSGDYVHWLTYDDNVVTFDVSKERFDKFSLPEPLHENDTYKCKQLVEYEGRLGLTCLTEDEDTELWVAEGWTNYRWTKKMSMNIGIYEKSIYDPRHVGFYSSQTAFMRTYFGAIFYNLQDCSFSEVMLDYDFRFARQIFQFRSDLEMVDLKSCR